MKISNVEVIKEAEMNETNFYYLKRNHPRQAELIKKGVIAEKLLLPSAFNTTKKKEK